MTSHALENLPAAVVSAVRHLEHESYVTQAPPPPHPHPSGVAADATDTLRWNE